MLLTADQSFLDQLMGWSAASTKSSRV